MMIIYLYSIPNLYVKYLLQNNLLVFKTSILKQILSNRSKTTDDVTQRMHEQRLHMSCTRELSKKKEWRTVSWREHADRKSSEKQDESPWTEQRKWHKSQDWSNVHSLLDLSPNDSLRWRGDYLFNRLCRPPIVSFLPYRPLEVLLHDGRATSSDWWRYLCSRPRCAGLLRLSAECGSNSRRRSQDESCCGFIGEVYE